MECQDDSNAQSQFFCKKMSTSLPCWGLAGWGSAGGYISTYIQLYSIHNFVLRFELFDFDFISHFSVASCLACEVLYISLFVPEKGIPAAEVQLVYLVHHP